MKVAIVGSRDYPNRDAVREYVRNLPADAVVVSGGASGVDSVAEDEASRCGLQTVIYLADWNKHGRAAGPIRNRMIVQEADRVVAFWDGRSRGTKNTIDTARSLGKPLEVYQA